MSETKLKVNLSKKEAKNHLEVFVEASTEISNKHYMLTLRDISNKIDIPGFRKGKVPREIVEKQVGVGYVSQHAFEGIFYQLLGQAAVQEKLDIVDIVEISSFELLPDKPLTFKVIVELKPEIKLGKYKNLKVKAKKIQYDKKLFIEKTLEKLANNFVSYKKSFDAKLKEGDLVTLDFEGKFEDGTDVPGGKAENYQSILDKQKFLPDFVDKLIGAKVGDTKKVVISFPENYAEGFSGKNATFTVKVNAIEEKQLPVINDEFAKQLSVESLDVLNEKIVSNMIELQESASNRELENNIVQEIVDASKFDLSESMIEKEIIFLLKDVKTQSEKAGVNWVDFIADPKNKALLDKAREAAIKRISIDLVLNAIVKKEGIVVTPEELGSELKARIDQLGEKYNYLENDASFRNTVEMVLLRNKAVDFLLKNNEAVWEATPTTVMPD